MIPITFSVETTKTFQEINAETLKLTGFYAGAVMDGSRYFSPSHVEYDNGTNTYHFNPKRYYPSVAHAPRMSFYCSNTPQLQLAENGTATIPYTVTHDLDLVAGVCNGNEYAVAMPMTMKHLLSQLVIKCRCKDATSVTCRVKQITVTSAQSGTYLFASDTWSNLGTETDYDVYRSTGVNIPGTIPVQVGEGSTYIAETVSVRVIWDVMDGGTISKTVDANVDIELQRGKRITAELSLDNEAEDVGGWTETGEITPLF